MTIGDNCVLHTASSIPTGMPAGIEIEGPSVIMPGCTLYSCMLKKNTFIGSNSVVLEGAILEEGAIVDANSVVPPGRVVPAGQVWGGNPIKFIRYTHDRELLVLASYAEEMALKAEGNKHQFLPYNNAYLLKENDPEVQ